MTLKNISDAIFYYLVLATCEHSLLYIFVFYKCIFGPLAAVIRYPYQCLIFSSYIIVSTGGIQWILLFSVHYVAAARREIFDDNAVRGKLHQLGSPNLQVSSLEGKLLWD